MLVRDEVRQQRDTKAAAIEAYADQVNRWTYEQLSRGVIVIGDKDAPINPERQMGNLMMPGQLERILRRLNPGLICEVHPTNASKRVVYHIKPDGTRDCVSPYENGAMPEYSIFKARYQFVPDPDFLPKPGVDTVKRVERRATKGSPVGLQQAFDLIKKHGVRGAVNELRKVRTATVDPDDQPGMKKVLKLWGEAIRGWRTVLVKIVQWGLCTPEEVERALRAEHLAVANNASWAVSTGKRTAADAGSLGF